MPKLIDLTGQRFERLLVFKLAESKGKHTAFLCKCDCGNQKVILSTHLRAGAIRSCGCLNKELSSARITKQRTSHGMSNTRTRNAWDGMKQRCANPNNKRFVDWGGRGIRVCDRWLTSFEAFYEDMGEAPKNLTLERIDVNGNYSCGHCKECIGNKWEANCYWATYTEQNRNRRNTLIVDYNGKSKPLAEWAELYGIEYSILYRRFKKLGWSLEKALFTPVKPRRDSL